jgi:WD40 repeat protein
VINFYRTSVLSLSFNPENKLLASGGIGDELFIWSLQDKKLIKGFEVSHKGDGGMVLDTNWSHDGIMLAAGNNKLITLFDIRYLQ